MHRHRSFLWIPLLLIVAAPLQVAAEEQTFDSGGVPISYTDMGGDGEPVVLLHSLASSSEMWAKAGFEPSDELRFIVPDLRGHGDSGTPADADAYGLELVEDVDRLFDHLGLEDAHVAGYSVGAEVALKFATEHPERVRSLVVGGSGWSTPAEAAVYEQVAMGLEASPSFRALVTAGLPADLDAAAAELLFGALEAHGIELDVPTEGVAGVAGDMGELIDLTAEDVAGIEVPVLGIVSENDVERPNIERLAGTVPDFDLVLIPAGPSGDPSMDHLGATQDPLFRESIVGFLSEQA